MLCPREMESRAADSYINLILRQVSFPALTAYFLCRRTNDVSSCCDRRRVADSGSPPTARQCTDFQRGLSADWITPQSRRDTLWFKDICGGQMRLQRWRLRGRGIAWRRSVLDERRNVFKITRTQESTGRTQLAWTWMNENLHRHDCGGEWSQWAAGLSTRGIGGTSTHQAWATNEIWGVIKSQTTWKNVVLPTSLETTCTPRPPRILFI